MVIVHWLFEQSTEEWIEVVRGNGSCVEERRSHAIMRTRTEELQLEESDSDDDVDDVDDDDVELDRRDAAGDNGEVCLLERRSGVELVRHSHSQFCSSCADAVTHDG